MKHIALTLLLAFVSGCAPKQTAPLSALDLFLPGETNVLSDTISVFIGGKEGTTLLDVRLVQTQPDGSSQISESRTAIVSGTPHDFSIEMSNAVVHRPESPTMQTIHVDKLTYSVTHNRSNQQAESTVPVKAAPSASSTVR